MLARVQTLLSDARNPTKPVPMTVALPTLQESFLQTKSLSKLREIAARSDENESGIEEAGPGSKESRRPLKRLLRGSEEGKREAENVNDFDDPEDENWEVDSSVSLDFKPKKMNTRTRASNRGGNAESNREESSGMRTRRLRKKAAANSEESEFEAEEEPEDDRRGRLRRKPQRKSYIEEEPQDDEEEEYRDSGASSPKRKAKKPSTNPLKRKERPAGSSDSEEEEKLFGPDSSRANNELINGSNNSNNYAGRTRNKKLKLQVYSDEPEERAPRAPRVFSAFGGEPNAGPACARCESEGASVKCANFGCEKAFHEFCARRRGVEREDLHFYCFECWLARKRPTAQPPLAEPQLIEFSRAWLEIDGQEDRHYVPQIGDRVYYMFQGHEEFLAEFWEVLDYDLRQREAFLPFLSFPSLKTPSLCEVVAVEYLFPKVRNKKVLRKPWLLTVLLAVTLREMGLGFEFKVQFAHNSEGVKSFLVLKDLYEYSREIVKSLEPSLMISHFRGFQELSAQILEVSPIPA